jgi:nucleoside-diphosphate-sugar epimerase
VNFLILGSSGMIGKGLSHWLIQNGHNVLEFDLKNSADQDLRIPGNNILIDLLKKADFVYFLAFDIGGSKYLETAQSDFEFMQNNLKIMINTFELLRIYKIPFIFSSSQMSQMKKSNYGLSKCVGEVLTQMLGGISIRFWNVYGDEPIDIRSHVVADFINSARFFNQINMLSDGTESRQMLHIDDCSCALFNLSQQYNNLPRDQQYHITSFEWITINDIANAVCSFFPNCRVVPGDKKDTVQQNSMLEPDPYILNYWQPIIDIKTGIGKIL